VHANKLTRFKASSRRYLVEIWPPLSSVEGRQLNQTSHRRRDRDVQVENLRLKRRPVQHSGVKENENGTCARNDIEQPGTPWASQLIRHGQRPGIGLFHVSSKLDPQSSIGDLPYLHPRHIAR
jgi:hypothetical protein